MQLIIDDNISFLAEPEVQLAALLIFMGASCTLLQVEYQHGSTDPGSKFRSSRYSWTANIWARSLETKFRQSPPARSSPRSRATCHKFLKSSRSKPTTMCARRTRCYSRIWRRRTTTCRRKCSTPNLSKRRPNRTITTRKAVWTTPLPFTTIFSIFTHFIIIILLS